MQDDWDASHYSQFARFVSDFGQPTLELLSPQPGERILDLGCGDGALTESIRNLGCEVVGVDTSQSMLAVAKNRGLDVRVADAEALGFENEFNAVFSNAALHWMTRPTLVINGVWRALKAGGRFVCEMGGEGNIATVINAIEAALRSRGVVPPNPLFFPQPDEYKKLLEDGGFAVETLITFPRPTPLPHGIRGWLETIAQSYFSAVPKEEQDNCIEDITEALRPTLCDADNNWTADYVRLRFSARKRA